VGKKKQLLFIEQRTISLKRKEDSDGKAQPMVQQQNTIDPRPYFFNFFNWLERIINKILTQTSIIQIKFEHLFAYLFFRPVNKS